MSDNEENAALKECYDTLKKYGLPLDTECDKCPGREDCRVGW